MKWNLVKSALITINAIFFLSGILFVGGILAQYGNGWLIPDDCVGNRDLTCAIITPLIIWGGGFLEMVALSMLSFIINRAVLRSFLLNDAVSVAGTVLVFELVISAVLFGWMGIQSN